MTACRALAIALVLVAAGTPARAAPRADKAFDHAKTRFPLTGRHQKVACESCHPASEASGGTRKWAGVPLDCHGCHGDRSNHKGALGAQCQLCHEVAGFKLIKHEPAKHHLALVGNHKLECVSCHAGGAHLAPSAVCGDCHVQPHGGTTAPCTTCHNLDDWKSVSFSKHTYNPELLPGKHRTATCLGCHPAFRFEGTSVSCESCHKKDQPHEDLGSCRTCHAAHVMSWGKIALQHQVTAPPTIYRVTPRLDHVAHAQKVAARGGKPICAACHVGLDFVKRPAMQACEACHDGKTSFDARGTQCSRCHKPPAGAPTAALPAPAKPFRHEAHAKLNVKIDDCRACHGSGVAWEKVQAGHDQHQPCQGCHAAEFRTVGAPICLSCHLGNQPFRPNPLRPPSDTRTEWRWGDVPHAPHLAARVACQTCHPEQSGIAEAAHPPTSGHSVCGQCHVADTPLTLDRCAACHVPASAPRAGREDRPWSTRDRFRHDDRHRAHACEVCHRAGGGSGVSGAMDLTQPTMEGCAWCHDGLKAFKTTGFDCIRCHERAARPASTAPR